VLQGYRGNPQISEAALDEIVTRIDRAFDSLNQLAGKAGAALTSNEWLMSVRSRINIPGGTCEFDLPGYYAWQQHPPESRRHDLVRWTASLTPLAEALQVLLGLLRDSGTPQRVVAAGGHFQQSLPSGRSYHLMRVQFDAGDALVPEISGHRLLAMVRFMQQDGDGRLKPSQHNTEFELTLCS
jgi:cell division protein ZapD